CGCTARIPFPGLMNARATTKRCCWRQKSVPMLPASWHSYGSALSPMRIGNGSTRWFASLAMTATPCARRRVASWWPAGRSPSLTAGRKSGDGEVLPRSGECIQAIERGPGGALTAAVVRLLVQRRPPEALPALLNYFPFADDAAVEEEVLTGLCELGVRPGKI